MKKLLLSALLAGLTSGAFAQGLIALDNNQNVNTSPSATTGGLVFLNTGSGAALITHDFGIAFYGGTDAANLTLLKTITGANAAQMNIAGAGTFTDLSGLAATIPNASGTTAFFVIEAWNNTAFSSYAAALAAGDFAGKTAPFANPVKQLPDAPGDFTGMPALTLSAVPEPGTFALAGLGAAALLIFRRRK
jgi:hypothetical protein